MSVVIIGSKGRMGQSIVKLLKDDDLEYIEVYRNQGLDLIDLPIADVVIDFSSPQFFDQALNWSVKNKLPFVSGTTGLNKRQFDEMNKASKKIPILWAANMSTGVAFINKLLENYKELSEDFDFQIEEIHHNKKVDNPSGTGFLLQKTLKKAVAKEIPEVLSVRGGGVYGTHKIWAMSDDEVITLEHQAINRDVFARGAIRCAKWLKSQSAGLYNVEDMF